MAGFAGGISCIHTDVKKIEVTPWHFFRFLNVPSAFQRVLMTKFLSQTDEVGAVQE